MKATSGLGVLVASLALLLAAGVSARAADDDVPSFKKGIEKGKERDFVEEVGTAILKAARSKPVQIELERYKFEEVKDKKGRKDLRITMNWEGALTKKKFTSTIVVKIDTSNDKEWEVLNVSYKDDNSISPANPNDAKIQALIKKFNR